MGAAGDLQDDGEGLKLCVLLLLTVLFAIPCGCEYLNSNGSEEAGC